MPGLLRRATLRHLLFVVLALTALSQAAVGLLLYRRLQTQLEADLGRRLVHVATLLALSIDAPLVAQFREGDDSLPAYDVVRRRLAAQAAAAGVTRAYAIDGDDRTLVGTGDGEAPGRVRHALLAHRADLSRARGGEPVATRLYADDAGALRLSAFAPVRDRSGAVVALVGVDAPPAFFAALDVVRREMLVLAFSALGVVALASLLVLRQVDARLARLRRAAAGAAYGEAPADPAGSVDVALLTCDREGRVALANPAAAALFGGTPDALLGRSLADLLADEPALSAFARSEEAADGGEVAFRGGLAGGGRVLAVRRSPLRAAGRPAGFVLSLLDVTGQRRAERRSRENERLAALGGMAGGLLHELGNPLAALTMYLDLLRPLAPAGEGAELLERARREDLRVQEFLEDFRVFAGLGRLRVERVDLAALVEAAAEPLAWPPELGRTVEGGGTAVVDPRLLAHAVRNLLRNAAEAMPGGGRIRVEIAVVDEEARLAVADDGPGLDAAALDRALDPFHTTKPHGTGLGLLIARRVAELHGGSLEAESRPGAGARFTLRWRHTAAGETMTWPAS
jgi:two-component system nitrogen regulation sensor histidine kinase GlnL